MISTFFIRRPVLSTVLSIIIVLAGLGAMRSLSVEQFPDIVPPEISVRANYTGANASVIADAVAAPLEQAINGVDNMLYMQSISSDSGSLSLSVTFEIGTDPDKATIDVNNRVQAAMARLPEEVRRQGIQVQKRSSSILQIATIYSPDDRFDAVYLSNYALLNVIDDLKRTEGVGDATLFGAKDYSMRIWLRPDLLAQYDLTPVDIAAAIREQNSQFAAGRLGEEPAPDTQAFTYTVTTRGRLVSAEEFENIILRSNSDGATLRLKDVARVELGAQNYSFASMYNGKPSVAIGIYMQPGANALATAEAVKETMSRIEKQMPEGIAYTIPFDTTKFVEISIHEVVKTFIEAIVLVILVVFLFLQNVRATFIPLLAVPVSLIGTFAGMYLFGFSINLLTLFGMVLAIGIVVDDAIVVLENVERIMTKEGLPPHQAAIKAMQEVTGPVIAIVLVLCAVFIPVGFLGGLTGQLYQQFAITIAVSVVISGIVALTLTPALCALMLKPVHKEPLMPFRLFNRFFDWVTNQVNRLVEFLMRWYPLGILLFAGLIAVTVWMFQQIPSGLVPEEDQGYIFAAPFLPPAAALNRTKETVNQVNEYLVDHPAVSDVVAFAGFDLLSRSMKSNAGVFFISLKDWDERKAPELDSRNVVKSVMGYGFQLPDGMLVAFNAPAIRGMSSTGGIEAYLQNRTGEGIDSLDKQVKAITQAAKEQPALAVVRSNLNTAVPQYHVEVDREKAQAMNVPVNDIFATMQSTFGAQYVNDFTLFGRTFRVSLQSEAEFRQQPEDLRHVFVRSKTGAMVPLSTLVNITRASGPDLIERFNIFPAAKLMIQPAPGYTSGQAIDAMEQIVAEKLPEGFQLGWIGSAYQEQRSGNTATIAFIFGIIMVFLILAAQYERWSLPVAVITAVPFGVFGAVVAVLMRGLANDVYFQIGLLVLIGLSAKNAILIVEFAIQRRAQGLSVFEAASEAAKIRFRPIVMTSLAFILGCVPLAISTGAGAGSRHSIGTGVIGGMLAATFLAIFFVPMFYRLIDRRKNETDRQKPV